MSFGQHQDTELWNNQISRPSFSGVSVSWRMVGLVYNMASRDKVDVDAFHKGIQYALAKLGKSNFVSLQVNLEFSAPYSFEILAHRPSPVLIIYKHAVLLLVVYPLACGRRRISGYHLVPPKRIYFGGTK